jgi:type IV secretory pathway TraG/TraD family ATPase VirD4
MLTAAARFAWNAALFLIGLVAVLIWSEGLGARLTPRLAVTQPLASWALGAFIIATAIVLFGRLVTLIFDRDAEGNSSLLVRRAVGLSWSAAFYALLTLLWFSLAVAIYVFASPDFVRGYVQAGGTMPFYKPAACLALIPFVAFWGWFVLNGKFTFAWLTAFLRRTHRSMQAGSGGSARFATVLEEWAHPWRKGGILLGRSIYDPGFAVGLTDNRHVLTIAGNRTGKGRSAIIPNLLTWPHSALVIDPKGTNAAVTAARRGKGGHRVARRNSLGQDVYVLNPFRVNQGLPSMPPSSRFNPLSIVDLDAPTAYEDLSLIADALVVPSSSDVFWDNSAGSLISATCGQALSENPDATLFDVREMLAGMLLPGNDLLARMKTNPRANGLIAAAANQIATADARVVSNIVTTALHHTDWLGSAAMQETLSANDFSIFDLKQKRTTIYVVLPPEYLETHSRFMRLFVNLSIKAASKEGRSKIPILFLLDEFYSLGPMNALTKAIGNLAGYNVKLWPILQNITQLVELYPKNWETFMANAGHVQVFGINDETTAEYLSKKLGKATLYKTIKDPDDPEGKRKIRAAVGTVELRDQNEIGREVSRRRGRQLIFREGEDPFLLHRSNYDQTFSRSLYNRDPDIKPGLLEWKS